MNKKILNWQSVVFLFVLVAAVFFRTYNFSDWLYFKMDQARDAMLTSSVIEKGPQYLPLLGPRAGATEVDEGYLRLGPAYYYFQYIAGVLSGSTEPAIFAYPDLFFGILAIPLLYIFLRLYFSSALSVLIASMYALSFIIIQYSRFAWNPNTLPFFAILSFFGLLKFLNDPRPKQRIIWIILWASGLFIGSQMHFFGFFVLSGVSALMILVHYEVWKTGKFFKEIEWMKLIKYGAVTLAVFIFIYSPVIISDVIRGGENSLNLVSAFANKPTQRSFTEKIRENASEQLKYYCLITTASCYEKGVKNNFPAAFFTAVIMLAGSIWSVYSWKKSPMGIKRDFLALVIIWAGVFFILATPVAFQLRPRFFIAVFAVPFIFLGYIFQYLEKKIPRYSTCIAVIITLMIVLFNAKGTLAWFKEQDLSQQKSVPVKRTLILKRRDGVTHGQLKRAVDAMYQKRKPGYRIYFYSKQEHRAAISYLLSLKKDPELSYARFKKLKLDPRAQYFSIDSARNKDKALYSMYGKTFNIISTEQFGQLVLHELEFPQHKTSPDFQFTKKDAKSERVFWKDVFGITGSEEGIDEDEFNSEE